jgi:hypothetical protein
LSTTTTTNTTTGLLSGVVSWFQNAASSVWNAVVGAEQAVAPDVIAAVDGLVSQLVPFATAGAQSVEQAVANGTILDSEKRSTLVTQLEQKAQAAGYSLEQQGVSSAINLALEFGVTLFKLATGQAVGTPAGATTA